MSSCRPPRSGSSTSWGTYIAHTSSDGSVCSSATPSPRDSAHPSATVGSVKRSRSPEPDSGESFKRARVEDTRALKKPSKRARVQKARAPNKTAKRSSTTRKKIAKKTPTPRRSSSKRAPPKKTASASLSRRAPPSNSLEPVTLEAKSDKSESSFSSAHDHDSDYIPGRRRRRRKRTRVPAREVASSPAMAASYELSIQPDYVSPPESEQSLSSAHDNDSDYIPGRRRRRQKRTREPAREVASSSAVAASYESSVQADHVSPPESEQSLSSAHDNDSDYNPGRRRKRRKPTLEQAKGAASSSEKPTSYESSVQADHVSPSESEQSFSSAHDNDSDYIPGRRRRRRKRTHPTDR